MKTLFKKILVLAVMLGTYTSYANDDIEIATTFNYIKKGSQISVSDASGEVIYSGKVDYNGNITRLYDFTKLEDGKYIVEIIKGYEIEINTIEVKNHLVTFLDADRKIIHKPVIRNEGNTIFISKLSLNSEELEIELYFEGELIHSETVIGEQITNRVYQLDQTHKGRYTTIIKSNDRVFIENFRI